MCHQCSLATAFDSCAWACCLFGARMYSQYDLAGLVALDLGHEREGRAAAVRAGRLAEATLRAMRVPPRRSFAPAPAPR
jgi:hypothetical protein